MKDWGMAKKRRVSEIVEAVRECQRLNDEGFSWGYKLFAGLEAELTPGERRRANRVRRCVFFCPCPAFGVRKRSSPGKSLFYSVR